jgi:ubiquinone/menaquinone biosynthesis C-methylase UbiE
MRVFWSAAGTSSRAMNQVAGPSWSWHDPRVPSLEPEIREYYEQGREAGRLSGEFPSGPLELARTQELILRNLPAGVLDVLDVGGGPGVYAAWMAQRGHRVRLVDPVQLHLDQARQRQPSLEAVKGDARELEEPDGSVDVVLLLGPLYHLTEAPDRLRALGEAHRVLRPGGLVFAAGISRYAALLDLLVRLDRLHELDVWARVREAVATGVFRGHAEGLFTTAYFHLPEDLKEELSSARFSEIEVFNIEGPGFLVGNFADRWADPAKREAMLEAARLVEQAPSMMGASSHLLAVGRSGPE